MKVEQLRSFLEIVATGSFSTAANRLNVTQSTISARIRALEDHLGQTLLVRGADGVVMTDAGKHLEPHARSIVHSWQEAKREIALPPGYKTILRLGGPSSLWYTLMRPWVSYMREHASDVAIRLEGSYSSNLAERLITGTLDLGLVFVPPRQPGLALEELTQERLVLVCDRDHADNWEEHYVYVEWDEQFQAGHQAAFPGLSAPAITVNPAYLGLQFVLDRRASAYLPHSIALTWVEAGKLKVIAGAPEFLRPVYLIYREKPISGSLLNQAIAGLRGIATSHRRIPDTELD
ncbi:LysR family transcriptional regulator [Mesorhizobium hawassense]|uniref:LysR family transcriptional regulator n=1 Tax=Mesorhizobium hawassense TaxID=1209954 RepID=A0A330HLJ5_9HYPH|nr:LysR family transcriptional regulator [Mesorhizobium hawassense]RAZ88820.1 LysR family transcriptional regulator [Mesorhizobium hawassense]